MGVSGVAITDPFGVIRANPASYPSLMHTVFEAGIAVRARQFDPGDGGVSRDTRIAGLSLGVPFKKGRWGIALGVQPASAVNYKITDTGSIDGQSVSFQYSGQGGLNRVYAGVGLRVWQSNDTLDRGSKLSAGANFDYLFGSIVASRKAYYPANAGFYNSSISSSLYLRAPSATAGLQFSGDLIGMPRAAQRLRARQDRARLRDRHEEMAWLNGGKDPALRRAVRIPKGPAQALRFRLGASVEVPADLAARHTSLAGSFVQSSTGVEFPRDTISFIDGAKGVVALPADLGIGAAVYNKHWTVTLEMHQRDWRKLVADVEGYAPPSNLQPARLFALGGSWRPAGEMGGSFAARSIYRAGIRYGEEPVLVKGNSLKQIGMSFGLSLPVMGSSTRSRLTIGADLGKRSTGVEGVFSERFANLFVGVTITPDLREQWFKKRRID
jgi:hypothetical protein